MLFLFLNEYVFFLRAVIRAGISSICKLSSSLEKESVIFLAPKLQVGVPFFCKDFSMIFSQIWRCLIWKTQIIQNKVRNLAMRACSVVSIMWTLRKPSEIKLELTSSGFPVKTNRKILARRMLKFLVHSNARFLWRN